MQNLQEMICRRRSVRSYLPDAVDAEMLADICAFAAGLSPLLPGAEPAWRILPTEHATYLQKWRNPQFLAFYVPEAAEMDGLLNVGFMFQQLELYLQSLGLGACWVGLGWPDAKIAPPPQGMKLAVMMAFGRPDGKEPLRQGAADFKRRALTEISDMADDRLEPLRLAPSATNSQPWFVLHAGDTLHIYREELKLLKKRTHGRMNPIDMGIGLAHLYVSNPANFRFFRVEEPPVKEGYLYMGTVTL